MPLTFVSLAALLALTLSAAGQAVTPTFTYQGRLNQNGSPATGTYDLKFELFNVATGGTRVGAAIELTAQQVAGGLFSADLNFGGPTVFDGTAYWLAVSARATGTPTYLAIPGRTPIRTTPYSVHALSAGGVKDGAVTTAGLANGAVTGAKLAGSAVGLTQLNATGTPASGQVLAYNGAGLSWITPPGAGGGSSPWLLNGVNAYYNNGNVGIGTNTPTAKLDVRGMLTLDNNGDAAILTGTGTTELNRYLGLFNSTGLTSASGLKAGGVLVSDYYGYARPGKNDLIVKGKIAVGIPDPEVRPSRVQIEGQNALLMNGYQPFLTFTDSNAGWAPCAIQAVSGVLAFHITKWGNANNIQEAAVMEPSGMRVNGDVTATRLVLRANPAVPTEAAVHCNDPGVTTFMPFNLASGRPLNITVRDASVRQLTISGGADLAEPFAMSHDGVEPGTVVVIDEKNPGKLRRSTRAYDKKVAGIVSGANGIRPGISMIQEDKLEAGENVSLSGRVYVKANVSAGTIEPGDLLTTSDEPGRAMKAADHDQAQGAILGKAMTGLSSGEGMVLVLVTLQ